MTRSTRALGAVLAALVTSSCGSAPPPAATPSPSPRDRVVAANASGPADILDDCEVGFCIGVRGRGTDPAFELSWAAAELSALGITESNPGRLCHGYTPGLYASTWDDVSSATRIVAARLAEHGSSALVAVCVRLPIRLM